MTNSPRPHVLRTFWPILNAFLALALLWALFGGVWDPLPHLARGANKIAGAAFILALLGFSFYKPFRTRIQQLSFPPGPHQALSQTERQFLLFVFLWLSFMAVYKHNSLQSHTFELAIFNNVTWNAAHGNGFLDTVLHLESYLGDHWQPVLWIFTPFIRIWESGSVFILAQALAITIGAAGFMKLSLKLSLKREWVLFSVLLFLLHPDLHKIHRFDFHPETLGFAILPWALVFNEKNQNRLLVLALFLSLFLKEDFPIYTFALGLFLIFQSRKKALGLSVCLVSVAAFFLISFVFMPAALGHEIHTHMSRYAHLGGNDEEMVMAVLTQPHIILKNVLSNPLIWETALRYLTPLLFLPLFNGPLCLSALAAWAPHAISQYPPQQTLQCQYGVAILVFLGAASIYGLASVLQNPQSKLGQWLAKTGPAPFIFILLINFFFGVPRYFKPSSQERIKTFHELRKKIPPTAAVSGQMDLGPHVSFRKHFYLFPDFRGAEYIILDKLGSTNPFSRSEDYHELVKKLLALPSMQVLEERNDFLLIKRTKTGPLTREEGEVLPVDMLVDHGIYQEGSSFGVSIKKR